MRGTGGRDAGQIPGCGDFATQPAEDAETNKANSRVRELRSGDIKITG